VVEGDIWWVAGMRTGGDDDLFARYLNLPALVQALDDKGMIVKKTGRAADEIDGVALQLTGDYRLFLDAHIVKALL